jgi:hypothetical protein
MEEWRLRIGRGGSVVADSHHFDEKQDPDPHEVKRGTSALK